MSVRRDLVTTRILASVAALPTVAGYSPTTPPCDKEIPPMTGFATQSEYLRVILQAHRAQASSSLQQGPPEISSLFDFQRPAARSESQGENFLILTCNAALVA